MVGIRNHSAQVTLAQISEKTPMMWEPAVLLQNPTPIGSAAVLNVRDVSARPSVALSPIPNCLKRLLQIEIDESTSDLDMVLAEPFTIGRMIGKEA